VLELDGELATAQYRLNQGLILWRAEGREQAVAAVHVGDLRFTHSAHLCHEGGQRIHRQTKRLQHVGKVVQIGRHLGRTLGRQGGDESVERQQQ